MEPIIKVDNVSMCFNLSTEKHESLKEYLLAMVQGRLQYDEFYALKDVSLDIMPGDFYGLVGLNGSGKSTLLKTIAGVYKPTKGKVTVNGTIAPLIELGAGFDMDLTARENIYLNGTVLGFSPKYLDEKFDARGTDTLNLNCLVKVVSLDELIKQSDFITVHMPLTPKTKGMLNKDNIAKMKNGVRLINCARGGIINEQDLADAVKSGHVAGAAIDVFESEPIDPNHPLIGLPGVTLTPHLGASTVEAQVGVSVDVAQGIVAALNGEPVSTAVNMAPVSPQTMKFIKPYLDLAERLGCTACSLADGPISEVTIKYNGEIADVDTKMITIAAIKGMLNPILESNVNYVNAPSLAKERNIKITEIKDKAVENFANLITISITSSDKTETIQGTLFGEEGRIVSINSYRVDVDPHARILICPHINRPGVIGTIGSLLGYANINISGMQVGKTKIAGTSMMVLTIDNEIPDTVMQQIINLDGIFDAKLVNYYTV